MIADRNLGWFLLFSLLLSLSSRLYAATSDVPSGSPVIVDGRIETGEWDDALRLPLTAGKLTASVWLKHDGKNLLFRFSIEENPDRWLYCFPEIAIDPRLDGGDSWQADDHWFHLSATDCHSVGKREDYSGCRVETREWQGVPNYPQGDAQVEIREFEISIPLAFAGLEAGKEFAISPALAIAMPERRTSWPSGANFDRPASWGRASLSPVVGGKGGPRPLPNSASGPYLGMKPPGEVPEVFAPGKRVPKRVPCITITPFVLFGLS
jgi:hypothetical protein